MYGSETQLSKQDVVLSQKELLKLFEKERVDSGSPVVKTSSDAEVCRFNSTESGSFRFHMPAAKKTKHEMEVIL